MADDKAQAFFILNDGDAIEQKIAQVLGKALLDYDSPDAVANMNRLATRVADDFYFQNRLKGWVEPLIRQTLTTELQMNFRVDHFYESWNRTAGYRIRYANHIIQQEQIKIGY